MKTATLFCSLPKLEERKDKGLSVQKNTNYGSVALEPRLKREKGNHNKGGNVE